LPINVSRFPNRLQGPLQEYAALLQALARQRLLAITVYGAAADPAGAPAQTAVQSAVVLDDVPLEFVRELGAQGGALGRMGIQAPLLLTPAYLAASRDVFPIEFLDLQQRHIVILGDDYFAPLQFDRTHVRLQLERELKSQLLRIRQGVLAAGGRDQPLRDLYESTAEHVLLLLRAVLWLNGQPVPASAAVLVATAAEVTKVDLAALTQAVQGERKVEFAALAALYDGVTALADYVDGWSS
jgi:hypothetical protein